MTFQHAEAKDSLDIKEVVSLEDGGTSAITAPRAAKNLGMLLGETVNQPRGPLRIDPDTGKLLPHYFDGLADYRAEVDGPKAVRPGVRNTYHITNYDSRIEYLVSAPTGTIQIDDDKLHYTAPTDIALSVGFILNGEYWPLTWL